jgi:hypothetical protein
LDLLQTQEFRLHPSLLKKSFAELYETAKVANYPQKVWFFAPFVGGKMYYASLKNSSFSFSTG